MVKFAKIILIFILLLPFSGYALEMEEEEILLRPNRPYIEYIYLEQESIIAYFELQFRHSEGSGKAAYGDSYQEPLTFR